MSYQWSPEEIQLLDECARTGKRSSWFFDLFPKRSIYAVQVKMTERRKALGIPALTDRSQAPRRSGLPVSLELDVARDAAARAGSEQLLRRQLIAGQHNIVCPSQFVQICRSVGLAA